jgi:hypothetical protein
MLLAMTLKQRLIAALRFLAQVARVFAVSSVLALPAKAFAQIAVVGSTVEERISAPGESYLGTIVVRNPTNQDQPARIYQSDYLFYADGTSHFLDPGTTKQSNAKWITPTVRSLLVPPMSEMTVSYTVRVPAMESLVGTYWSTIMVEGAPSEAGRSSGGRPQVGVGVVVRYAVQIATHIQSTGSRKVAFAGAKFLTDSTTGRQSLELEVQNAGERAYRPALWIEVYDEQGALKANARQERGLLYPGTSLKQVFQLGKLPSGTYRAVVFADSGEDSVLASQFTLKP